MLLRRLTQRKSSRPSISYQPFQYRKLRGAGEIRLLEVSSNPDSTALSALTPELHIRHINLNNESIYTAISYMWALSNETEEIMIDNHAIRVQAELKNMITDLACGQTQFLWIDAICINQDDIEERNSHVRMIGDIYSRADHVIAYIRGTHHPNYHKAYRRGKSQRYLGLYSVLANIEQAVAQGDFKPLTQNLDYNRFFNNIYFHRRWTIQELSLARSVIIRCDGYELSLGVLEQYFITFGKDHGYSSSRAAEICRLRQDIRTTGGTSEIEHLLYYHAQAVCRERLDKVYALLFLWESDNHHVTIDYNVNPLKTLVELIRTAFLHEQLDRSRLISFACFLRHHLEITAEEFETGFHDPVLLNDQERWLEARLKVRGILRSQEIDPEIEDSLNKLKPFMPSMRQYSAVTLQKQSDETMPNNSREMVYQINHNSVMNDAGTNTRFDALNLSSFSAVSFRRPQRHSNRQEQVCAGLSTCLVKENDQIWQFARTRIALIARRVGNNYILIGRALLINNSALKLENSKKIATSLTNRTSTVDGIFDWIGDEPGLNSASIHDDESGIRTIKLRMIDLLGLMKWVDGFAD